MTQIAPPLYDSFALYSSGVTLVTVRDGNQDRFFVAASVSTASVDPYTLAVSVSRDRDALPAIISGTTWAISVLATHHLPLVRRLTGPTARTERLDALHAAGAQRSAESPLWLPDALVTFWCTTYSTTPVHDQLLLVGQVNRGSPHHHAAPLLRSNREFHTVATLPGPQ